MASRPPTAAIAVVRVERQAGREGCPAGGTSIIDHGCTGPGAVLPPSRMRPREQTTGPAGAGGEQLLPRCGHGRRGRSASVPASSGLRCVSSLWCGSSPLDGCGLPNRGTWAACSGPTSHNRRPRPPLLEDADTLAERCGRCSGTDPTDSSRDESSAPSIPSRDESSGRTLSSRDESVGCAAPSRDETGNAEVRAALISSSISERTANFARATRSWTCRSSYARCRHDCRQ